MPVDRLSMQFYSLGHPRGSHIQYDWLDMGNPGLSLEIVCRSVEVLGGACDKQVVGVRRSR
jgi:hypothetical protein